MKNYQDILWDWDGCLAKTLQVWLEAYKIVFAEFDLYPEEREITEKVFGDWEGPKKLGVKDNDKFIKKLLKIVNKRLPHVELYDHAKETLNALKSIGKRQVLLTSSKKANIKLALKNNQVQNFFEFVLTEEDVRKHKPDPEIFEKAITKLGGNKKESLIIGDSKKDLEAARNGGIDSVLFFPSEHKLFYSLKKLKSYHPTYIIGNFGQLVDILVPGES